MSFRVTFAEEPETKPIVVPAQAVRVQALEAQLAQERYKVAFYLGVIKAFGIDLSKYKIQELPNGSIQVEPIPEPESKPAKKK